MRVVSPEIGKLGKFEYGERERGCAACWEVDNSFLMLHARFLEKGSAA